MTSHIKMSLYYFHYNATKVPYVDNDCIEEAYETVENYKELKIRIERYTDPCLDKVKTKRQYEQWVIRDNGQVGFHYFNHTLNVTFDLNSNYRFNYSIKRQCQFTLHYYEILS